MTLLAVPVLCTIFVIPLLFEQPIIITSLLVFWQESDHKISQHVGYQNRTPIPDQPVFLLTSELNYDYVDQLDTEITDQHYSVTVSATKSVISSINKTTELSQ